MKIKVTGILSRDKKIDFLGRVIQKIEYGLLLGLPEGYFSSVYESYGIKKGTTTPPDLRKIMDDALEKPECQKPLTAEAASRYRSAVGKISWGGQTRIDLTYFISVLSRGQSTPLVVHETCLRAFLRYLMSVDHLKQLMGEKSVQEGLKPSSIRTGPPNGITIGGPWGMCYPRRWFPHQGIHPSTVICRYEFC